MFQLCEQLPCGASVPLDSHVLLSIEAVSMGFKPGSTVKTRLVNVSISCMWVPHLADCPPVCKKMAKPLAAPVCQDSTFAAVLKPI